MSSSMYFNEPDAVDVSDRMADLLAELARGRCMATVAHGDEVAAFYNEGSDVWPMHFRAVREAGAVVTHAGKKGVPDPDSPWVTFARGDAVEGEEVGWMQFKFPTDN